MQCQVCGKNPASVHITEIHDPAPVAKPGSQSAAGKATYRQKHICEACAQMMNLPHMPVVVKKNMVDIWKLLQRSAERSRQEAGMVCEHCQMSLGEFRSKGRLGCPDCYESFRRHLDPLLERIHNASHHTGRLPGMDERAQERRRKISSLREKLVTAIKEEAYEDAASLRDLLQALEAEE